MKPRIVIAMSGGVDSTVAALLLQEEGYEVIGISMKLFEGSRCCTAEDVRDAKEAAAIGGFPHYTVNFKDTFEKEVVNYFVDGYLKGETPNPCVLCNQEVKFKVLLRRANELGASAIASGHYARILRDEKTGKWLLMRGRDPDKDQSYFLATIPQDILKHLRFPLGDYTKDEVREIARKKGISFSSKEESQELCFIPDGGYPSILKDLSVGAYRPNRANLTPLQEGEIVNSNGEILGRHTGIANYTIGQRRGLGVALGKPLYVTRLDPVSNRVYVGEDPDLFQKELIARSVNWIHYPFNEEGRGSFSVTAKIRSRHAGAKANVELIRESDSRTVRVDFVEPQRAITPGQLVVFYDDDIVLGGGWIQSPFRDGNNGE
jgi:tRNA-specific 2-thiouridylase